MGKEIERKFLTAGEFRHLATKKVNIVQAYLCVDPVRTIRIRITDLKAWLTIKGAPEKGHIGRNEWELEIPGNMADDMLKVCLPGRIEKTRYLVPAGSHVFEVDEFHGKNEGLVVAEIELGSEDEEFDRPDWLGIEVTGRPEYQNSNLI
jgi:adenylate cyclase